MLCMKTVQRKEEVFFSERDCILWKIISEKLLILFSFMEDVLFLLSEEWSKKNRKKNATGILN